MSQTSLDKIPLKDLAARWTNGKLTGLELHFSCPACRTHRVHLPVGPLLVGRTGEVWKLEAGAVIERITLSPEVNTRCWRGAIVNGEAITH